jgi:predicted enzyme related to lactoylglutathione lyase
MKHPFDRTAEDLGNVVALEHVNTRVPDQRLATLFYVSGLGLTRDPYLMTGVDNMWANVGRSQFHLPTGKPQVVRGVVGLVLPGREALLRRLAAVKAPLEGTQFGFLEHEHYVEAVSPWGNRMRCHEPGQGPAPRFGRMGLGLPYVEFAVPVGTAPAIARFYREVLGTPTRVADHEGTPYATASVGPDQVLAFRESEERQPEFDGHHVQVYLADFSGPYRRLLERGLISQEDDQHQYRFIDIVDLETNRPVFAIEHEVRSMRHPLYARPLVNRNPAQTNRHYMPGHDSWRGALPE